MATTFTSFSRLPYEIRAMIWLECIPSRVVELDVPCNEILPAHTETCISWTAHQNTRPPVLSRVCHESREIILKLYGRPLNTRRDDLYGCTQSVWFNGKKDTVFLSSILCFSLPPSDNGGDDYFIRCAKKAQEVAVPAQIIYPFHYLTMPLEPISVRPRITKQQADKISKLRDITVCLKVIQVHMSAEKALKGAISGPTGDQLVLIVNVDDSETIEKIADDAEHYHPSDNTPKIFALLKDTKKFLKEVRTWERHAAKHWTCQRFVEYANMPGHHPLDPDAPHNIDKFWTHSPDSPTQDPITSKRWDNLYERSKYPQMDNFELNMTNPWSQWAHQDIPNFKPVIMFRLCVRDCSALSTTSARRDIYSGRYPDHYVESAMIPKYQKLRMTERREEVAVARESRLILKRI